MVASKPSQQRPVFEVALASGGRLRVLETRDAPRLADLETYLKEYATGRLTRNARHALEWLPPPDPALLAALKQTLPAMNIRRQALFVDTFARVLDKHIDANSEVDFATLPKDAVWSMAYYCAPRAVRLALWLCQHKQERGTHLS